MLLQLSCEFRPGYLGSLSTCGHLSSDTKTAVRQLTSVCESFRGRVCNGLTVLDLSKLRPATASNNGGVWYTGWVLCSCKQVASWFVSDAVGLPSAPSSGRRRRRGESRRRFGKSQSGPCQAVPRIPARSLHHLQPTESRNQDYTT